MPNKKSYKDIKILIVDDSSFARALLIRELNVMGIEKEQIYQVSSGEEAITEMNSTNFDLFILDIIMTGIDGVEVLKKVKELSPASRIVMCSSCNSDEMIRESVQLGIDAFVMKPYDLNIFSKVVSRIIAAIDDRFDAAKDGLIARCHLCDREMVEINSIDTTSFFCPNNCMKIGPVPNILVTQSELDNDYEKARKAPR